MPKQPKTIYMKFGEGGPPRDPLEMMHVRIRRATAALGQLSEAASVEAMETHWETLADVVEQARVHYAFMRLTREPA